MSFTIQTLQHCFCVSTVTQSSIKAGFSRLNIKEIYDLLYHNRDVHSCRRISFLDYMFNSIFIFLRLKFLVFLFKFLRIFSFIADASFVWCLFLIFHSFSFSYHIMIFLIKPIIIPFSGYCNIKRILPEGFLYKKTAPKLYMKVQSCFSIFQYCYYGLTTNIEIFADCIK